MLGVKHKQQMPTSAQALVGRDIAMRVPSKHFVLGTPLQGPFAAGFQSIVLGLGCFWGAERKFWSTEGVFTTAVGYTGGFTPNPTYQEVCSGLTGHNEVVLVVYDPRKLPFERVLEVFWESHDPTQGMRQGNDVGTQYRSGIYVSDATQREVAMRSRERFQSALEVAGYGTITTEIIEVEAFYYAEDYHQQYLAKNPGGYCGLGGTGVRCASGLEVTATEGARA